MHFFEEVVRKQDKRNIHSTRKFTVAQEVLLLAVHQCICVLEHFRSHTVLDDRKMRVEDEGCDCSILFSRHRSYEPFLCFCPGEESNLHALRHEVLNLACLPFHHLGMGIGGQVCYFATPAWLQPSAIDGRKQDDSVTNRTDRRMCDTENNKLRKEKAPYRWGRAPSSKRA